MTSTIMKGLNIILDDLERLGKISLQDNLGYRIKQFAQGFKDAVPHIEAALYGGEIKRTGEFRSTQVKGLANGGQDFQIAVDALQQLMNAAQGTMLQGAVNAQGGGNVTSVDNSSSAPTTIVTGNGGGSRPGQTSAGVASGSMPHWMAGYYMQGANSSQ